jgi:hypothetical protein
LFGGKEGLENALTVSEIRKYGMSSYKIWNREYSPSVAVPQGMHIVDSIGDTLGFARHERVMLNTRRNWRAE